MRLETRMNIDRFEKAEREFAELTGDGRDLAVQQDVKFQFCDGEIVTGWGPAADTAERHVRAAKRQAGA